MPQLTTVKVFSCGCVTEFILGLLVTCAQAGCLRGVSEGKSRRAWVEPAKLIRFAYPEKDSV